MSKNGEWPQSWSSDRGGTGRTARYERVDCPCACSFRMRKDWRCRPIKARRPPAWILSRALPENAPLTLAPMQRALVPTGLIFALPPGTEGQVRPRSGLAVKRGLTVLNSPGTIDSDYRGEVSVS